MLAFSESFQRAHDIDWFAKVGYFYVHAMSFGGLLPLEVNDRHKNFSVMRRAFAQPLIKEELKWNEKYIEERIRPQSSDDDDFDRRRNRYLRHFNEMAMRGFLSFDRDLKDETLYHLIARPKEPIKDGWYKSWVPEIPHGYLEWNDGNSSWDGEQDCVLRIRIEKA